MTNNRFENIDKTTLGRILIKEQFKLMFIEEYFLSEYLKNNFSSKLASSQELYLMHRNQAILQFFNELSAREIHVPNYLDDYVKKWFEKVETEIVNI